MPELSPPPSQQDENYQNYILEKVSRTFALTIPQLPNGMSRVVSNAYLLCRIADTIEDDKEMSPNDKRVFSNFFNDVISGDMKAAEFSVKLEPLLSDSISIYEKQLIVHTPTIIRITHSLNPRQRQALARCVRIMADGMSYYQEIDVGHGLQTQKDMDRYCYYVAGVVGEMLTELFCDYSERINQHYDELIKLSVSFGQGLQMVNILKDIWDDRERNMCWLPQEVFTLYGASLDDLCEGRVTEVSNQALGHIIGVARSHLENALKYTLLIPVRETGIRRFCLWALGMAVLTLRNLNSQRNFTSGQQVKISRFNVKSIILLANLFIRFSTGYLNTIHQTCPGNLCQAMTKSSYPTEIVLQHETSWDNYSTIIRSQMLCETAII
jgi:farnesyl-diphosphate farnesyltransferase